MKRMCAECEKWTMGDFWGSGTGNHAVLIECKGWCHLKPNKRKRWNYHPVCKDFIKRKVTGFFYEGGDKPLEEDLANITVLIKELVEDNKQN